MTNTDIDKKALVKIEGNVCEYPFFSFSKSKNIKNEEEKKRDKHYREFSLGTIIADDGSIEERKLILRSPEEFDLPSAFEHDILMAISYIGTKNNTLTGQIYFTLHEIAKLLGQLTHKSNIKKGIKKMANVTCEAGYTCLVKNKSGEKIYLNGEDIFHIFERTSFWNKKTDKEITKRNAKEVTWVEFNKYFIQNFLSGYFQYINFSKYVELNSPIARRLYVFLSKKKFGRSEFKISIEKLANVIPIQAKKLFNVRQILKEACERLINQKVISGYDLGKGAMDITFYFLAQEIKEAETPLPLLESPDSKDNAVYDKLVQAGVSKGVAKQLITKYPIDKIRQQIKWVKYREAEDPAAVLVSAIKDDWAPPKGYMDAVEKEKIQKETNDMMKKVKNAEYIIFPSGSKHEISRKFADAVEYFIDDKKKCVILINRALDCRFE